MTVEPAPWHIAVEPSEVDAHEEERPTGLIVQHHHDHTDNCPCKLKRGVVLAIGSCVSTMHEGAWADLNVGDVLFYHEGVKLQGQDYILPGANNVVAVERNA